MANRCDAPHWLSDWQSSGPNVYDRQPIIDHFRMIDPDRLLGLMDLRQTTQPFFFYLTQDEV